MTEMMQITAIDYCIAALMLSVPVVIGIGASLFVSLVLHVRNKMS